jgi:hypothetical protein
MSELWDCVILSANAPFAGKLDEGTGLRICPFDGAKAECIEVAKKYGGFYARTDYPTLPRPKEACL